MHGPEPSSMEADVYVWRYALLVVHARKEEAACCASSSKLGERAFSVIGPTAWNSLPYDIR